MSTDAKRTIRKWEADDDNQRVGRDKPSRAEVRAARALVAYVLDEIETNYRPSAVLDSDFTVVDPDDGDTLAYDLAALTTARTWTVQDVSGTVYVSGGTDVPVTDGGTGASTAANARKNLGLGGFCSVVLASDSDTDTSAFNPFDQDEHSAFAVDADVATAVGVTYTSTDGRFTVDTGFGGTWLVSVMLQVAPSASSYVEIALAVSGSTKFTARASITGGSGYGLMVLGPVVVAVADAGYVSITLAPSSGNVRSVARSTLTMVRLSD